MEEVHECPLTTCQTKLQFGILWMLKQIIATTMSLFYLDHIYVLSHTQWHPYKIALLGK